MKDIDFVSYHLHRVFGDTISVSNKQFNEGLPLIYSSNYYFYSVKGDFNFTLISQKNNVINLDLIDSIKRFLDNNGYDKLLFFSRTPTTHMKNLFKQSLVSFVSIDGDVYIADSSSKKMDIIADASYTKATQLVINYYLEVGNIASSREIANYLGISSSGVNRAQVFLNNLGALDRVGTTNILYKLRSKKEMLDKTEPYWIRPFKCRVQLLMKESDFNKIKDDTYLSGDDAFERYTTLASPKTFLEVAVEKSLLPVIIDKYAKNNTSYDDGVSLYSFEEFIYDPSIFARNGLVSRFDLYIILSQRYKGSDDPRIIKALKELKEGLIR